MTPPAESRRPYDESVAAEGVAAAACAPCPGADAGRASTLATRSAAKPRAAWWARHVHLLALGMGPGSYETGRAASARPDSTGHSRPPVGWTMGGRGTVSALSLPTRSRRTPRRPRWRSAG